MYKVIPLQTLSKIIVTENCGDVVNVTLVNKNITVTKITNLVNITNCGS